MIAAHDAAVRTDGLPLYKVYPESVREQYSVTIYLESFAGRNLLSNAIKFTDQGTVTVRQRVLFHAAAGAARGGKDGPGLSEQGARSCARIGGHDDPTLTCAEAAR